MKLPDIIIAIDGYSSTGKSTLAKLIAEHFSFLYLDSGALYRGVTLHALENNLISEDGAIDEAALKAALPKLDLDFRAGGTHIGDRCIEKEIRTLEVSGHVSPVSAIPFVREYVDERLHAFGRRKRVVMDGRDIGTTVFPDAEVKIFMTASDEVRAKRRYDEMKAKGQDPTMEEVMKNLRERDYIDSHREVSPLSRAADAFVLDNSDMNLHEELVWFQGLAQGRFGILE
ncbi:MAG: (d)CMP kinase [Bacteroidales bacterium]|uniref:(d)CMP kinase n=1 Tax=Candidatus Cryptobacteroides bacterium TaxID=3085639 RepID=UPI000340E0F6|nr:(d)CMP kinase [Bacteroidales bacterium]MCI6046354.1 (d)CMP kinase [Alistipes sp.]MDY4725935.1 (d)CMP kinase [Candidatus Cryptobacteroides sp.]MDY5199050.1 (d)CMP kinase [Candidatus Cryptobacteroides sp.]CCX52184.1 cytidylate kinase [Alistipes sp. CAG:514]